MVVDYQLLASELRKHVKGVIACDAYNDPPLIVPDYEGPYDIILYSLSLLTALSTEEEFNQVITKLTKYLKTSGKLLIFDVESPGVPFLCITPDLLTLALK